MAEKISVMINGETYEAAQGEYILETARRNNIFIPTLCDHPALSGQGCCRVCIVEIKENGRSNVVVSCVYPITRSCEIFTESDKIVTMRRIILSMLRDRAPSGEGLDSLCEIYNVHGSERYTKLENEKCILCGLCARACEELGAGAIGTVNRGIDKKVSTPYNEPTADCVGCLSCAQVCPTHAIPYKSQNGMRMIWGKEFDLIHCENCGKAFATEEELRHAEYESRFCEACRRKRLGNVMAETYGIRPQYSMNS